MNLLLDWDDENNAFGAKFSKEAINNIFWLISVMDEYKSVQEAKTNCRGMIIEIKNEQFSQAMNELKEKGFLQSFGYSGNFGVFLISDKAFEWIELGCGKIFGKEFSGRIPRENLFEIGLALVTKDELDKALA